MIYISFLNTTDGPWTPVLDPDFAKSLSLAQLVSIAKDLRKHTKRLVRVKDAAETGWQWGSDLPIRELVKMRMNHVPYAARGTRYAKRHTIPTNLPMPKAPGAE